MAEYGYNSRKCRWCGTSGKGHDCGGDKCVPQDMRDAIMRWKEKNGKFWRDKLQTAWMKAGYPGASEEDACLLQQARNRFGSQCLNGPNNVPDGGE